MFSRLPQRNFPIEESNNLKHRNKNPPAHSTNIARAIRIHFFQTAKSLPRLYFGKSAKEIFRSRTD